MTTRFDQTPRQQIRAFTVTEFMIAISCVLLVMSAVVSTNVFGLKTVEYIRPKLNASDDARKAVSMLMHEIRSAHLVRIGNGTLTSFSEVPVNTLQAGNAIQVYSTTNLNEFVRYYWDGGDRKVKRTSNIGGSPQVIAQSVSNQVVFTAEDFRGNVLTNNHNNRVIGVTLHFYQLTYPTVAVGPGSYYDHYQLRSKITRRTLL
jgi:Tfp pilus assembly protein PilW